MENEIIIVEGKKYIPLTISKDIKPEDIVQYKNRLYIPLKKNYEILKFSDGYNEYYKTSSGQFTINLAHFYSEEELIDRQPIISIKVLPSEEIFTVGEKVEYYGRKTEIEKIYFNEHNQLSFKVKGERAPLTGCFNSPLIHLKKVKEPILITEDGVELYEGDKDYEILSFKFNENSAYPNNIWVKGENNLFGNPQSSKWCSEENMLKSMNGNRDIYSIRRTKDRETFTIGDNIEISELYHKSDRAWFSGIISKFYAGKENENDYIGVECEGKGGFLLTKDRKINKVKIPILTTEDKIEIFDEEVWVFYVTDSFNIRQKKVRNYKQLVNVKFFADKENAEKFVELNKKVFSKQDIINAIKATWYCDNSILKEFKEKLEL